jgi:hypothetical protein
LTAVVAPAWQLADAAEPGVAVVDGAAVDGAPVDVAPVDVAPRVVEYFEALGFFVLEQPATDTAKISASAPTRALLGIMGPTRFGHVVGGST